MSEGALTPPLCTRIIVPLTEKRTRLCGRPAAFAVGVPPDVRYRCARCVAAARQRGERLTRLVEKRRRGAA